MTRQFKAPRVFRGRMSGRLQILALFGLLFSVTGCADAPGVGPVGPSPIPPTPPATNGDRDNDGIPNNADRCPNEPETRNGIFDNDGCPDQLMDFYVAVRQDVEAFWNQYFGSQLGRPYIPLARVQAFTGTANSPCGPGRGPFYCGVDGVVYLDDTFMQLQLQKFGDFAPAVIIAHEIGHHTQNLLGLLGAISIQKELQADCLAGAWAASASSRGLLDAGDIGEGAASLFSVGDPGGTPWFAPGAHGSPQQRQQAFFAGFQGGARVCG